MKIAGECKIDERMFISGQRDVGRKKYTIMPKGRGFAPLEGPRLAGTQIKISNRGGKRVRSPADVL